MRRNDLSGAHEWRGADELIRSLIVCRCSGRKMSRLCRLVMRSVFEGGVGCDSGGSEDKSSESGVRDLNEAGDDLGELEVILLQ
jgi:hypothetical protein